MTLLVYNLPTNVIQSGTDYKPFNTTSSRANRDIGSSSPSIPER